MRQPPTSESDLLRRAHALTGRTVTDLLAGLGIASRDPRHSKGLGGQAVERWLGATAGSQPEPDFPDLGIELKTVPLRPGGRPAESTWVCHVPLLDDQETWASSGVRRKLARVLWIPLQQQGAARVVGVPRLWSPSAAQEATLCADWQDLMELVVLGRHDEITGHQGVALQIRPKAAHSGIRRVGLDAAGHRAAVAPLGFYLRAAFTAELLRNT